MKDILIFHNRIKKEWDSLQKQWQETSLQWRDSVKDRFEQDYWREYEPRVASFLREVERISEVIKQARHEVK